MLALIRWSFLGLALTALSAQAEKTIPADAIVADLGLHVLGLGYQRTITPKLSAQVAVDLYVPWTQNGDSFRLSGGYRGDVTGLIMRARVFVTLIGDVTSGMWLSPFAQFGVGTAKVGDFSKVGPVGAGGLSLGYQGIFFNHLLVSGGLGLQYHAAVGPPPFGGVYPTIDLVVGYAW